MKDVKIDLDVKTEKIINNFAKNLKDLKIIYDLDVKSLKIYETRKGFHAYINFEKHDIFKSDYAKIIIQMFLGSDPRREMFNLKRLEANNGKTRFWNILFKAKKYKNQWFYEKRRKDIEDIIYKKILGGDKNEFFENFKKSV